MIFTEYILLLPPINDLSTVLILCITIDHNIAMPLRSYDKIEHLILQNIVFLYIKNYAEKHTFLTVRSKKISL